MPEITTAFTLTRNGNHIILSFSGDFVIWKLGNVILTKNTDSTVTLTDQITSYTMTFSDCLNPVTASANAFLIAVSKIINEQSQQFTAFGEQLVAQNTPVIQLEFPNIINPRLLNTTVTNSGGVSSFQSMAIVSSGTSTSSLAELQSIKIIKYRPGQGVEIKYTSLYTTGVLGTTQFSGIINDDDGFAFGVCGVSYGILHRNDSVDTWIYQEDWNVDKANGSGVLPVAVPTNLNVYRISYQWLGAGLITFEMEDAETGFFEKVHVIKYANNFTVPSLANPSLPFTLSVNNGGTTSDIVIKSASIVAAIQGVIAKDTGLTFAFSNTFTGVNQTIDNVFGLRTKTIFGAGSNHIEARLNRISIGTDGNGICIIEVFQNPSVTSASFVNVDLTSSIMETDIAGTGITGGDLVYSTVIQKAASASEIIETLNIRMAPGDTLYFAARTFAATNDVTIAVNWTEEH